MDESNYGNRYDPNAGLVYSEEIFATYDPVEDAKMDNKVLKQMVGDAIRGVDGVLALKGGLTDIFKRDEDLTRGITVHQSNDGKVRVSAKVIAESGYDSAQLIQQLTDRITQAMQSQAGLQPEKVEVEIADKMTQAEFYDKYDADRALH